MNINIGTAFLCCTNSSYIELKDVKGNSIRILLRQIKILRKLSLIV